MFVIKTTVFYGMAVGSVITENSQNWVVSFYPGNIKLWASNQLLHHDN